MIEPKEFYRKLDNLLSKINKVNSGSDFLFTIVNELGITFGNDLHIGRGRVYEKNGEDYELVSPLSQLENIDIEATLSINSNAVQSVLNSKTYIFDNPVFSTLSNGNPQKVYAIPAAIVVHNQAELDSVIRIKERVDKRRNRILSECSQEHFQLQTSV